MAVVAIKRKSGVVYYVDNIWQGKPVREKSGTSKRQAEIDDRAMKNAIKEGTFAPKTGMRPLTLKQECELFLNNVEGPSRDIYSQRIRLYVLSRPWLADMRAAHVEPIHIAQLVAELKQETKPDGSKRLKSQSIRNVLDVLMAVFSHAISKKRCADQPVVRKDHKLDDDATERQPYSKEEVVILTRHHAIRWPTRVINALILFTGMREGEACGRRWRDITITEPLHCLDIRTQYNDVPLKTKRPRKAPIHPDLTGILSDWFDDGFELYVGRKPNLDDFIVPCVRRDGTVGCYTKHVFYQAFIRGCIAAGVVPRTLHATRHTFITLCRRADCNDKKLTQITHNPKGKMIDQYTHRDWSELCEVVFKLNLDAHQDVHLSDENPQILEGIDTMENGTINENSHQLQTKRGCPASGRFLSFIGKTSQSENTRQDSRQEIDVYRGQLREANQRRKRRLRHLQRVDPTAVATGLFLSKALDCAYSDDRPGIEANLVKAEASLGRRP